MEHNYSAAEQVERFRSLGDGDVIVIDEAKWKVESNDEISSKEPFIGEVRLSPWGTEDAHEGHCLDYRCRYDVEEDDAPKFRVKNAQGEWGYEDEASSMFDVVETAAEDVWTEDVNYVLEDLVGKAWDDLQFECDDPPTGPEFASDLRCLADRYEQDTDGARRPR